MGHERQCADLLNKSGLAPKPQAKKKLPGTDNESLEPDAPLPSDDGTLSVQAEVLIGEFILISEEYGSLLESGKAVGNTAGEILRNTNNPKAKAISAELELVSRGFAAMSNGPEKEKVKKQLSVINSELTQELQNRADRPVADDPSKDQVQKAANVSNGADSRLWAGMLDPAAPPTPYKTN